MKRLSAKDMLNIWELGLNQPLLQQALILLVAAYPELEPDELAKLSIGQRDERLLRLRQHLFGTQFVNVAACPECSERIEWENNVADFLVSRLENDESTANEFHLDVDKYHLCFRLPNSLDIADIINNDKSQEDLLKRCILNAKYAEKSKAINQLPKRVMQALSQRIETLDSQAEISINLHCPECSHHWVTLFDIASFLWIEINDWAERTLQMIHKLAKAYGWTEQEILNLSSVRRQLYLGMLG